MSGHSKWSTIKHKKAAADAKRGKLFSKLIREITTAAKAGGGDPAANPRLRTAMDAAKAANMPSENIDRAVKRGTGELPGVIYEEVTYEAYGPAGVALVIEVLTDNKNRTLGEIKHTLSRHNGSLGGTGSVSWQFKACGIIHLPTDKYDEDQALEMALDAGAEDFRRDGSIYEVRTEPTEFGAVRDALENKGAEILSAELTQLPQNTVALTEKDAAKILKLIDALEDLDDVQTVYANFDISEEVMEKLAAQA
ncbi:YebC/PmpR family DNA-binding transcriptional regulator [candidate division WOR-3 bacterium]|nr:YebC/PmpR family DNA-binding transcriptional regulator [candidate division WOR-3 bacterium]